MAVKVAVIGAGTMGSVHARAYTRIPSVQFVGIADIRDDAGKPLADECKAPWYKNIDELFEHENPDVVDVCVPTYLHREVVEQVASRGKHVICEKPIARNLEDARAMIDTCKKAGVTLTIAHVLRFFPEFEHAHAAIAAGDLGQVGVVRTMRGGAFPHGWQDWYAKTEYSGTLIVDMIIHDFDFLRWCFGDVERVYAKSLAGRELNRLDHAFVTLRFQNGVIAHTEGTWAYPSGFSSSLEIAGSSGILHFDSGNAAPVYTSLRSSNTSAAGVMVPESPLAKDPYQAELEHFIECIADGKTPLVTAEDAYEALAISLAALESARTGNPVTMAEGENR